MRTNIFKLIITLPYFLNVLRKSRSWFRKITVDANLINEEKRYKWVNKIARYILWLHNVKIHTLWKKHWIDGATFIAPNHQSNMDGAILFSLNNFKTTAPCAFIGKEELTKSKKLYRFLSLIDVVFIDRQNLRQQAQAFKEATDLIRIPRSMVVFPEGTRNPDNKNLIDFKDGAFKLAQKAYAPIVPVTIYDSFNIFNGSRFKKKDVYIIFHKPIEPIKFMHMKTNVLSDKVKKIVQSGLDNIDELKKEIIKEQKELKQSKKEAKEEKNKYTKVKLFSRDKKNNKNEYRKK